MPDSQTHRPGVSVRESPGTQITKKLAQAADIEQQLEGLPSSTEDDQAQRLRRHLCEILSDILLLDSQIALEHNCCSRLFNNCFYKVVSGYRKRILREKRKKGPNVKTLTKQFKQFLNEASGLYKFLVDTYHAKLLPDYSQDRENSQADNTQESSMSLDDEGSSPASTEGVVNVLFYFYIHHGDLYRYAEAHAKAEACYLNAAKLAPGKGNPYNQLAVVTQIKDETMSCVALYWYARSLISTHQAFETSTSNLDKLFTANRAFLQEHSRDNKPTVLEFDKKQKISSDILKAQKAAANKSLLAHFVDMHYDLYMNKNSVSNNGSEEDPELEPALREKMLGIMQSLESIFKYSAFGDSLLCKMVTINTFTFEITKRHDASSLGHRLSREFIFVLGWVLGKNLEAAMSKVLSKDKNGTLAVKLLLPFEILCEFIFQLLEDSNISNDNRPKTEEMFWNQFAKIANLAVEISKKFELSSQSLLLGSNDVPLKEYQLLRGCKPFSFLFKDYASGDPFISPSEAIDVLELTMSQSQESASGRNSSGENKTKLVRFLTICENCSNTNNVPIRHNENSGYAFDRSCNKKADSDTEDKIMEEGDAMPENPETSNDTQMKCDSPLNVEFADDGDDDDAGDVVMYKPPETGDGPALLVPGALLTNSTRLPAARSPATETSTITKGNETASSERTQISNTHNNQPPVENPAASSPDSSSIGKTSLPPPSSLPPPPGFAAPIAQPSPMQSIPMQPPAPTPHGIPNGLFGQSIPSHAHSLPPVSNAANYGTAPVPPQQGLPGSPLGAGMMPYGQSWQLFGGPEKMQTSNPFAGPPPYGLGYSNSTSRLFEEQPVSAEGTALLDSALIDSLFMNDTKSNNPWK